MNLKAIIIGLILILIIVFGVSKILESLKGTRDSATTVLKESIGLKRKAKGLVEKSRKQMEEREKLLEQE